MEKSQPEPNQAVGMKDSHNDEDITQTKPSPYPIVEVIDGAGHSKCNEGGGAAKNEVSKAENNEGVSEVKVGNAEAESSKRNLDSRVDTFSLLDLEESLQGHGGLGAVCKEENRALNVEETQRKQGEGTSPGKLGLSLGEFQPGHDGPRGDEKEETFALNADKHYWYQKHSEDITVGRQESHDASIDKRGTDPGHSQHNEVLAGRYIDYDLLYRDLLHSAMGGYSDTVRILIDAGADVNATDFEHDTPLHKSAEGGHSDTVKILIDAGADVNAEDDDYATPLHRSATGHPDTVKILIDAGADVNVKDASNAATPLHVSAFGGDSDTVKILIDAGADLNAKDDNNDTPLHIAANEGESQVVEELILNRADVNLKNKRHRKPIHLAVEGGHTQTVNKLTDNLTIIEPDELSTLLSLLLEAKEDIWQIMCRNSSICNARYKDKRTLLHVAAQLGCYEHIPYLISCNGGDANPIDDFGKSPLHYAVEIGNEETIKELLKAGCNVHELDATGRSVLHLAAINGHCDIMRRFIEEYGLDPYKTDVDNRNCLHYAVIYRREDTVALLIEKCSDSPKNTQDFRNKFPSDYLHRCEKDSLIWKYLHHVHGRKGGVAVFEHDNTRSGVDAGEECLDIRNVPGLSKISKQPFTGSVTTITGYDNDTFVNYVKENVQQVIQEVILEGDEVEVIGVGSSFEGSKQGMPDEFDFLVKLPEIHGGIYDKTNEHEGYRKMEKVERDELVVIGSYGMWMWSRLMEYWSDRISKYQGIQSVGDRSFCMLLPPQRHPEHKTCTTWIWLYTDEMFTDFPVSINLVPALQDYMHFLPRSTWMRSMNKFLYGGAYKYVVPKIPYMTSNVTKQFEPEELAQLGRVSYPTLEVEHIKSLNYRVKNVFITAKCIRKADVCGFKIRNNKGKVKSVSELVTSYRLKSVFMHLVELFLYSNMSLGKMVLMVYEHLEKCLERDNLPMFFDPKINVLVGSKLSTKESLQVTRIMTRFVRCLYEMDVSAKQRERDSSEEARVIQRARDMYEEEWKEWMEKMDKWSPPLSYWKSREPIRNPLLY